MGQSGTVFRETLRTYLGNVQRDLKLNFETDTEVLLSCGASLNGQYWIIGGRDERNQVGNLKNIKIFERLFR